VSLISERAIECISQTISGVLYWKERSTNCSIAFSRTRPFKNVRAI
jgi:hypothetical protein